ncbi:glycerol-3-phosphate acyltransferase 1-like [Salvia miltiorrhiza]|uniref:glycerol-3-phosphate acyltransferase 1-like n=1 Tax=Salvia miltiorrhiza TaxID=226208 RepID=UPI0025ABA81F|nr:glycerol-3-phosphate acyltransferase 1-like [Salvia miltiorrhiza]
MLQSHYEAQEIRPPPPPHPSLSKFSPRGGRVSLVCDIHRCLLRSPSFFPYFMLVAFEGGGPLRALLLLLSCPLLLLLDYETKMRAMIFITFCGMRQRDAESVSRAVLPKFYLENLNLHAFAALDSAGYRAVFTAVPRVMVEHFLKEYLAVDSVVGTELRCAGEFFTGLVSPAGLVVKHRAVKEMFGDKRPDVGIGASTLHDHFMISLCKESYVITREDNAKSSAIMPRSRYPKPLVFHDGRLAFLPTPAASLAMFLWLPFGILLAVFRLFIGICLPYHLSILLGTATGIDLRVFGAAPPPSADGGGVLYVCSHRTLLDPVFLSTALRKPLTAVTYSLSKMSEIMAPIRTVRLTRDRWRDGATMQRLLAEGDLVVCPEGTTCREPYLLRFSSLFTDVADEIVPVAVDTEVGMFYGTTAGGMKWLDPIFFLMNPRPVYGIRILEKVPRQLTCAGGRTAHEVANYIQRELGASLGFECTNLTRKDKYLMLVGNDGVVKKKETKNS